MSFGTRRKTDTQNTRDKKSIDGSNKNMKTIKTDVCDMK